MSRRAQQVVLHRVVVDLLDAVLGGVARRHRKRDDRIGKLRLKRRDHVVSGHLRTVVVRDPLTQRDLPRARALNRACGLRQIGEPVAVLVEREQRIEDRLAHQVGGVREVVGDRVDAVAIGLHCDPKDAAALDLFLGNLLLFRRSDGRHDRVAVASVVIGRLVAAGVAVRRRVGSVVIAVIAPATGRGDHHEGQQQGEQLSQARTGKMNVHRNPPRSMERAAPRTARTKGFTTCRLGWEVPVRDAES